MLGSILAGKKPLVTVARDTPVSHIVALLYQHLIGAVLMGVGGVTALGCTIGQGLSGVSNLSLTSFTAVAGIVAGAVVALKYQAWRLEKSL